MITKKEIIDKYKRIYSNYADDVEAEIELILLIDPVLDGGLLDRTVNRVLNKKYRKKVRTTSYLGEQITEDTTDSISKVLTPKQKYRFKRNLVIQIAHKAGISIRILAEIFKLPRSSVGEIIRIDLKESLYTHKGSR